MSLFDMFRNYKALWNQGLKDDIDVWVPDTQQEQIRSKINMQNAFEIELLFQKYLKSLEKKNISRRLK